MFNLPFHTSNSFTSHMNKPNIFILAILMTSQFVLNAQNRSVDEKIKVRKGYELSLALDEIRGARFLQTDGNGTLFISLPSKGEIKSCKDTDGDGYYDTINTFVKDFPTVHGMQWDNGWLWFTQSGVILKARDTNNDGIADETITVIADGALPKGGGHWWRPILIMNDRIYTAIGCSGNITEEGDTERLKIWSFDLEGKDKKLFATGLRNTEKLVNRPGSDEIWGMDHGSDWFGRHFEGKERKDGQPNYRLESSGRDEPLC